jgi:hypothetical protein
MQPPNAILETRRYPLELWKQSVPYDIRICNEIRGFSRHLILRTSLLFRSFNSSIESFVPFTTSR